ncbi:MAG: hypothetical protein Q4P20_06430 [Eubacteriales bacterium]|nr:hypothetical protein [Eubacteriales bacterium]
MKKSIIALSLCCVTLFAFLMYQQFSTPATTASEPLTAEEQQEAEDHPLYLVRAVDGVLAIYPYGSDTASEVTDIHLSSLREYDQQLMQRGFPLYSEQDLTMFLEDFGS